MKIINADALEVAPGLGEFNYLLIDPPNVADKTKAGVRVDCAVSAAQSVSLDAVRCRPLWI